jgi:WD40 repeat protein
MRRGSRPRWLAAWLVLGLLPLFSGCPSRPRMEGPSGDGPAPTGLQEDPLPDGAVARLGTTRFRTPGSLVALALSPDGKVLASGESSAPSFRGFGFGTAGGGVIRLWDPSSARELRHFAAPRSPVRALAFAPDGKTLASGTDDSTLRLWDTATGKELWQASSPRPTALTFAPDGKALATANAGESIQFRDVGTGKELRTLEGLPGGTASIAYSRDGKTIAAGSATDQGVGLWDVSSGRLMFQMQGHSTAVRAVAFAPDGKLLASGGADGTVRLWDPATGKELRKAETSPGGVSGLCFSPDGQALFSTGASGTVCWDPTPGKNLRTVWKAEGAGLGVVAAPDGRTLAWCSHQALRLADPATGKERLSGAGHRTALGSVAVSPDGGTAVTAGGGLWQWDLKTGEGRPGPERVPVSCAAFAPDGKSLVLGGRDQTLRLWDPAAGRELRRFSGDPGEVEFVSFLPDGKTVLSMSRSRVDRTPTAVIMHTERLVRFWDVASGEQVRAVGGEPLTCAALAPDGKVLATAMDRIDLWDVASGKALGRLPADRATVRALAFSDDGGTLASSLYDQDRRREECVLWDVATRKESVRLEAEQGALLAVAFAPQGNLLATGGGDRTVRLWDVASGKELRQLPGHGGPVTALAFTPDGRRLISGSQDTTALVWDLRNLLSPQQLSGRLPARELEALWDDLGTGSPAAATRAVTRLVRVPEQSVPFLKERWRPAPRVEAERLARLIADLDDDDFKVREKAQSELARLGRQAEPALRAALDGEPSAPARVRVEALLKKLPPDEAAERTRMERVLEVLERIGTGEARQVVESIAREADDAATADAARTVLQRLDQKPRPKSP